MVFRYDITVKNLVLVDKRRERNAVCGLMGYISLKKRFLIESIRGQKSSI